jgi:hypothetical protein
MAKEEFLDTLVLDAFEAHLRPVGKQGWRPRRSVVGILAGVILVMVVLGLLLKSRRDSLKPPGGLSPANGNVTCVDFREAGQHAGQASCVTGRVLKVFTSRAGNTFIDFCEDYHDCPFTSLIFASDREKFGDPQSLAGRQIEIRGRITVYRGKPEIVLRDPEQIHVAP